VSCEVAASAVFEATAEQFPSLRQNPGAVAGEPLPTGFLKHSDDQTVAGLAAVYRAIHGHGLEIACLTDWGIVAAPRFLGRSTMVPALQRFASEGAWGISPHLIPHRSLHSLSGTISQALKIHGPNFGAGGGLEGSGEAMLAAAALMCTEQLPGLWLVLTGWTPEPFEECGPGSYVCPDLPVTRVCRAVALALRPQTVGFGGPWLDICAVPSSPPGGESRGPIDLPTQFSVEKLVAALTSRQAPPRQTWELACGGTVELRRE
jgi:hypothetical protein